MASEADFSDPSFVERLISSRNRDLSLFLPFILALTNSPYSANPAPDSANPDQQTEDSSSPDELLDRIILVNPLTQGMVVIEGVSSRLDSLLRDLVGKDGQPPASKASMEAMPSFEIGEETEGECCICLEEWEVGAMAKEMPCKHRFHGGCIEKWLKIHGSCPACRYEMPAETDDDDLNKKNENRGRREIWVSFSYGSDRTRGESGGNDLSDSTVVPSPDID